MKLGEIQIEELEKINNSKGYNFSIKQTSYNICYIENDWEEWYVEYKNNMYYTYHKNTRGRIYRFHPQEKFINVSIMMDYIFRHRNKWKKKLDYGYASSVDEMFAKIM